MSPITVQASAGTCKSQSLAAMAYSLDSGRDTIVKASALQAQLTASVGQHTVRVKSWGNRGALCQQDLTIEVLAKLPTIPANVSAIGGIQAMKNWVGEHDWATSGSSTGSTAIVASPALSGQTRQFTFSYQNDGGHRFHVSFPANPSATHFVYETYLMIPSSGGNGRVANVEMDMNQVLANRDVVIYGVQCDGWTGTWDYTVNEGTVAHPRDAWRHSELACDPKKWTKDTWHHVQITYERDDNGNVTYDSVSFDAVEQTFNSATGPSLFGLNWGPVLLTNLQLDGEGSSGTQTVAMSNTTLYAW
jgi:hypothetical protein